MRNFTLFVIIILLALGTWQLRRLQVKTFVINKYHDRQYQPALKLPIDFGGSDDLRFCKVELVGKFLEKHELQLYAGGRGYAQASNGYLTITPFQLSNEKTILVNRGLAPSVPANQQLTTISGVLFKGERSSIFVPGPDLEKNIWFTLDLPKIKAHTSLDLITNYYVVEANTTDNKASINAPVHNDHLQYAITWYLLAVMISIFFYKYQKKGQ